MVASISLKPPVHAILKVLFHMTSSHAHNTSLLFVCPFSCSQSAVGPSVPKSAGSLFAECFSEIPLGCRVRPGTCHTSGFSHSNQRSVIAPSLRLTEQRVALLPTSVQPCVNSVNKSTDIRYRVCSTELLTKAGCWLNSRTYSCSLLITLNMQLCYPNCTSE